MHILKAAAVLLASLNSVASPAAANLVLFQNNLRSVESLQHDVAIYGSKNREMTSFFRELNMKLEDIQYSAIDSWNNMDRVNAIKMLQAPLKQWRTAFTPTGEKNPFFKSSTEATYFDALAYVQKMRKHVGLELESPPSYSRNQFDVLQAFFYQIIRARDAAKKQYDVEYDAVEAIGLLHGIIWQYRKLSSLVPLPPLGWESLNGAAASELLLQGTLVL